MTLDQLRRLRWAVRGTLALALAFSVAANILHAPDDPISRVISAWPPIALMLAAELISRVPARSQLMSWARIVSTVVIAGIAAWISYWHMAAVAAEYGERDNGAEYLWPLTVDGLAIVASLCLVELGRQIAAHSEPVSLEPVEPLGEPVYVSLPSEPVSVEPYELDEPEPVEPVSPGVGPVAHDPSLEPFDADRWESRLNEPLAHPDPWLRSEPVKPRKPEPVERSAEPVIRKLKDLGREPAAHDGEPVEPLSDRELQIIAAGKTNAERVALAHGARPDATNQQIAVWAGVSLATAKRHRPPRNGSRDAA